MRIEEAVAEHALQPRTRQEIFSTEGVVDTDERTLELRVVAAWALHLTVEGVLDVLRRFELVLIPFDRL